MTMLSRCLTAAAAGAALFASAAAVAVPAEITADVRFRAGPGADYPMIGALIQGERVDAVCEPGTYWCHVIHNGISGWVSSYYVATMGPASPPTYTAPAPSYTPRPIYPPAYIIEQVPPYVPPAYTPPPYAPPVYYPPAG